MTTREVTIAVTAEHIAKGECGECAACPVALAILEVVRPLVTARVDGCFVRLATPKRKKRQALSLPAVATGFIVRFDFCGTGEPFAFPLRIREDFLREESRSTGKVE